MGPRRLSTGLKQVFATLALGGCLIQAGRAQTPDARQGQPAGELGSVPSGTVLHVRLRDAVSSFGSKAGMPVSALVIQPVLLDGRIVIPLGAEVDGTVVRVRRIGIGFASETALVDLSFDTLRMAEGAAGGEGEPVSVRVSAVDNSRETVDAIGAIHGIRATASASKILSGVAVSAASLDPMSLLFGLSASLSAFRVPESEIILPAGAELQVRTEAPIAVRATYPEPPRVTTGAEDEQRLATLVRSLPYRTATAGKGEPSDLTTILLLGDEGAIIRALDAAGWSRSDALGAASNYGVMRSVVENQGYKEGPVSTLLLDGKEPVGAWSKTLDTFFARHHLRLFAQGEEFDGRRVFVSSATHDSGIGISKANRTLIHLIDEHIDEERGKVVSDLLLTGCVEGVEYVDRPWIPQGLKNATGDTLRTDGRMAVVKMNACADPRRADAPAPEMKRVRAKAVAPERVFRDGVLYLRDDVVRGNVVYQSYSAGRMVWKATHKDKNAPDTGEPKTIHVAGEPYLLVTRPKVTPFPVRGQLQDPGTNRPSFYLPGKRRKKDYRSRLEYSISGGYSRFANREFSTQPLTVTDTPSDGSEPFVSTLNFVAGLQSGYAIAPRATINSWRYVSNEFGYTYSKAALSFKEHSDGFDNVDVYDGQVRQFSYNAVFHLRPNGSRFRPYAAVGPVFQLLRLYDATPSKNALLKFTVKDLGLIIDSYNFGHKPPLEGGGIFQFGMQYGGGFKYAVTPRMFVRSDFRQTLSPQPDYWSKSAATLASYTDVEENGTIAFSFGTQTRGGPLRQNLFLTGIGVSF